MTLEEMQAFREEFAPKPRGQCMNCELPAQPEKRKCLWCALNKASPDEQLAAALDRKAHAPAESPRTRPKSEWPPGMRWCGSCRSYVGLTHVSGSVCRGCSIAKRRGATWKLTDEQQHQLMNLSGGRCFGCGHHSRVSALAVDHNHYSDEIRGLLCGKGGNSCNEVIGLFHDDPVRFLRLAMYLLRPPARKILDPTAVVSDNDLLRQLFTLAKSILDEHDHPKENR